MPDKKPPTGGKKVAGIDKKWWLIGGGIAVVAVGYSYHKAKQRAATTTTATTDPSTTDPSYSDPYGSSGYAPYASGSSPYPFSSIDPNTGVPYAQEVGSGGSVLGTPGAPFQIGGTLTTVDQPAQTNATWMTAAVQALEHSGYTSTAANLAISQYLLGMPLTSQEVGAVQAAVSMVGPPPNPVALHTVSTPSTQGTGGVTQPQPPSNAAPATPALSLSNAAGHEVHVSASKVAGAVLYEFYYGGAPHMAGPQPSYTSAPHPVGFHYGPVTVRAVSATGKLSPFSAPQSIVVK